MIINSTAHNLGNGNTKLKFGLCLNPRFPRPPRVRMPILEWSRKISEQISLHLQIKGFDIDFKSS